MGLLSGIAGKIVLGLFALAVVAGGISWSQADPATRSAVIDGVGRIVGWVLGVLVLPWALFMVIGRVERMDSNAAGVVFVGVLSLVEAIALALLFEFRGAGGAMWSLAIAAVLVAVVYNTFTCDWIAEKVES